MPALGILAGRGYVSIVPDLARFNSQLAAGVNSSLAGLSKSGKLAAGLSSIGSSLTKFVTLPLGIAGAASVKMALDFESSFAKIGALAGNLGVSLEEAKRHVLELGGQTAQSPKELTDALYFVASAGLESSQVMSVLDFSAKGAAVGMGTASEIAQTLTSVLNAYAGTGLDAGTAMNIMTQAVKSGKAEMTDFATGLGPVVTVAAQAGVSFNDLAAAIAQSTNLGVPFDRAVTGMRFLIQSLEAPTAKSVAALDSIGVSVDDLHAQLAQPGGLQTALQDLAKKFDLSTAAGREGFAAVVGGSRGAIVAMGLVGDRTKQTNTIVRDLGAAAQESSTVFEQAFAKVTGTSLFKAQAAIASFKSSFTKLGIALLPVATKLIGFVTDIANAFSNLSPAAQENVIKFGALALAAGPVLKIFGALLGPVGKLVGLFGKLGSASSAAAGIAAVGTETAGAGAAAGAATGLFLPLGAAIVAVGVVGTLAAKSAQKGWKETTKSVTNDLKTNTGDYQKWATAANKSQDAVLSKWTSIGGGKGGQGIIAATLQGDADAMTAGITAYRQWEAATFNSVDAQREFNNLLESSKGITVSQAEAIGNSVDGLHLLGGSLTATETATIKAMAATGNYSGIMTILKGAVAGASTGFNSASTNVQTFGAAVAQAEGITNKQRDTLAKLLAQLDKNKIGLDNNTQQLVLNALETGHVGKAIDILSGKLATGTSKLKGNASAHQQNKDAAKQDAIEHEGLAGAMGRMSGAAGTATGKLKNMESAHQAAKDAAIQQGVEDGGLAGAFGRMGGAASTAGGKLKGLKGDHDAAGGAATGEKGKVDNLNTSLGKIPASKKTTFETPNLDKSYTAVFNYSTLLGNVPKTIKTVFQTVGSAVGGGSSGGSKAPQPPKYKPPIFKAGGGVFPPGYAGGALFRTPFGHEFIAGEGNYPTFLGRGKELVVGNRGATPLTDRIIDRIGDRVAAGARAHWVDDMSNMSSTTPMPRGGVRGRPLVIHTHVHVDRREIARAVANSSVWDN